MAERSIAAPRRAQQPARCDLAPPLPDPFCSRCEGSGSRIALASEDGFIGKKECECS